jgi:hypothetical protein
VQTFDEICAQERHKHVSAAEQHRSNFEKHREQWPQSGGDRATSANDAGRLRRLREWQSDN